MSNHVTHSKSVYLLLPGSKHTQFNLYQRTHFSKLEVGRLDSRLSSFVIISSYIHTLSWCQLVVRIQIASKTIPTPENWEIESKEVHLTAIKLSETDGFTHNKLSNPGMKELENKKVW